ncbi:ferredoxin [Hyaloscypha hepaticicola]|uniref:Ferredoxin n=1 Tax=Hyaloscypha hepaticicola TaxID=2082293 RepID=A0A2J6Q5Y1_9HELO|nr:ferredoxin [Hyaloscypha hepaticicola]
MSIHTRASIATLRTCSPQHSPISTPHYTTQKRVYPRSHAGTLYPRRAFSATSAVAHGHLDPPKPGEELYVTFVDKEGDEHKIAVSKGNNLLEIAQTYDIEMEGACEGSCSCSTCHVIVEDEAMYDKMEEASDDENDMLDLAFGLTETSRLGCQVVMSKELDGLRVRLPSMTRNMQASDFSKKT